MSFDWFNFISGIIAAAIGSFISQRLTADNEAIVLCRQDLLELEKKFAYIFYNQYLPKLLIDYKISILEILKKFEMHHINLLIHHVDVQTVIDESYEILNSQDNNETNWWVEPLLKKWNYLDKSQELKRGLFRKEFFYKGFVKRLCNYLIIKFKRNCLQKRQTICLF